MSKGEFGYTHINELGRHSMRARVGAISHKMIHGQSQTDHIAPRTPHDEMSSGPTASGVKVPTCGISWATKMFLFLF